MIFHREKGDFNPSTLSKSAYPGRCGRWYLGSFW